MERIVIDASVVVKWFVDEEGSEGALAIRKKYAEGEAEIIAPELILFEALNALRHKGLFTEADPDSGGLGFVCVRSILAQGEVCRRCGRGGVQKRYNDLRFFLRGFGRSRRSPDVYWGSGADPKALRSLPEARQGRQGGGVAGRRHRARARPGLLGPLGASPLLLPAPGAELRALRDPGPAVGAQGLAPEGPEPPPPRERQRRDGGHGGRHDKGYGGV